MVLTAVGRPYNVHDTLKSLLLNSVLAPPTTRIDWYLCQNDDLEAIHHADPVNEA